MADTYTVTAGWGGSSICPGCPPAGSDITGHTKVSARQLTGGLVVVGPGMVDGAVVVGSVATVLVGGTKVDDVGATVVVVSGGAVLVVVSAGGCVVAGAVVPLFRGAVVFTGACVVAVAAGDPATVVVVGPTVEDVEEVDDSSDPTSVVVGCNVVVGPVVEEDWLATCCLGAVSVPVATSNRRAARAIEARA